MIMLLIKYGLRSGDVVNLKFEDIDWENKIIRISQNKTKRDIKLLLLLEVGNAIIGCLFCVYHYKLSMSNIFDRHKSSYMTR